MQSTYSFTWADLEALRQYDCPTICNALEVVVPERRAIGFTVEPMVCVAPNAPSIIGRARTGTIRAREPARGKVAKREDWYDYVADSKVPTIVVIQDIDDRPGYGAFWGEVQSNVHKALGAVGCVTNGSFRDLGPWAEGFQMLGGRVGPSHAHVHMVDFGQPVNVFGMQAAHDDIVFADHHGAVIIPEAAVSGLAAAIDLIARREKVILDICKDPGFTPAKLKQALLRSGEIH
jgi:regulator of RNase E activity RraA